MEQSVFPDYNLDDSMELARPDQFMALAGKTRPRILGLLGERAATNSQLAESLGLPKGTVGHHLKVLESAGLIRVVRTRQVRAITEKYYGLVARTRRVVSGESEAGESMQPTPREMFNLPLRQAMSEVALRQDKEDPSTSLMTHARVPASVAREFALRLEALSNEFRQRATPGEEMYGFVAGIYLTDWPDLQEGPGEAAEQDADKK